ncbi:hypothetical protein, partial [Limnohabitans sp.]|uniref:hypothetical protein n=1 Tax=Limnohabitans sp. TaxID=1907725 RepID=UPI00333EBFAB
MQLSFLQRLKVDYLDRVLLPGHMFSLPNLTDCAAILSNVMQSSLLDADQLCHAQSRSIMYFMVVDTRLRRRKVPRTEVSRARQHML